MNDTKPNIIAIMADDLGYGDIGVYGNPIVDTPHIDALARSGVRLDQHYSASPICAPARAAFLTGRYNHRVGAVDVSSNRGVDRIALCERTLGDVFSHAGYVTGMIGKWHNGLFDMRHHPNARGFREFLGFLNGGMGYYDWILDRNGSSIRSDGRYLTDVFSDEAVSFIHRHAAENFFLTVTYNAPHSPLEAPEMDAAVFEGTCAPAVAALYGMIRVMDRGIGRILSALDACGLSENTIVLFTSDNGPFMGNESYRGAPQSMLRYNGPFSGMKYDVLEGGIRVPAVLRWPGGGLSGGTVRNDMIHFCDWIPTLAACAGIRTDICRPLDGMDMLPYLQSGAYAPVKRFWQYNRYEPALNCNAAMRDGDWKLYWPRVSASDKKLEGDNHWYRRLFHEPHFLTDIDRAPIVREIPTPGTPKLFNIADDPAEAYDRAGAETERAGRMRRELENWFESVNRERRNDPDNWRGENTMAPMKTDVRFFSPLS
ncbi:MAG: sulfatase-like hydrolase/transferase [Spirochaetota bacterium]